MCSKTCHLVKAPLITQVKTTALGAVDPPLFTGYGQKTGHLFFSTLTLTESTWNAPNGLQGDATGNKMHSGNRDI